MSLQRGLLMYLERFEMSNVFLILHHPQSICRHSDHSAANRCSLSFYSCAREVHPAAELLTTIVFGPLVETSVAAGLHLRNVVVVNPGHEPWGGSFYKCDACLQRAIVCE